MYYLRKFLNKFISEKSDIGNLALGYDPYDYTNTNIYHYLGDNKYISQVFRICPINIRKFINCKEHINTKACSLILIGLINLKNLFKVKSDLIEGLTIYLLNKSIDKNFILYGVDFKILLSHHNPKPKNPDLIISLFVVYSFIEYWRINKDKEIYNKILSFYYLIEERLPKYEDKNNMFFSYNFEKFNEIYNSTAKIGKFYALLYLNDLLKEKIIIEKIEKILNYLKRKQRKDGSWAYGEKIGYTDGFHTAFILEAIWYMLKVVDIDEYKEMFDKGLIHYKKYLFKENGQPLYFNPVYKPKDIRRYLIETDIRDCAMAIILFSKINDNSMLTKVLNWTINNMYDMEKGYFYYYKNTLWTNKIEFIRWQAWMLYALSHIPKPLVLGLEKK